ncbi:hypothetical protein B7463_g3472, partial [Scytalidium lignicola]
MSTTISDDATREVPSASGRVLAAGELSVAAVEATSLWCATCALPRDELAIMYIHGKGKRGKMPEPTDVAVHSHPTKLPWHRATPLESKAPSQPFLSQLCGNPHVLDVSWQTQPSKKSVHVGTGTDPEKAPLQLSLSQLWGAPQVPGVDWHWHPTKLPVHQTLASIEEVRALRIGFGANEFTITIIQIAAQRVSTSLSRRGTFTPDKIPGALSYAVREVESTITTVHIAALRGSACVVCGNTLAPIKEVVTLWKWHIAPESTTATIQIAALGISTGPRCSSTLASQKVISAISVAV